MVLEKNTKRYLYISTALGVMFFGYVMAWMFTDNLAFAPKHFFVAVGSAACGLFYFRAFSTVKTVSISNDYVEFLPNGFKLDIQDIENIERVSFRNIRNVKPVQLFLSTKQKKKFKWIPGSLVRADRKIIIDLLDIDGETFVGKLEAILEKRVG